MCPWNACFSKTTTPNTPAKAQHPGCRPIRLILLITNRMFSVHLFVRIELKTIIDFGLYLLFYAYCYYYNNHIMHSCIILCVTHHSGPTVGVLQVWDLVKLIAYDFHNFHDNQSIPWALVLPHSSGEKCLIVGLRLSNRKTFSSFLRKWDSK